MKAIADDVRDMTREAMIPGTLRPAQWAPLSKDYAKWKYRKTGVGVVNLVLSGRLGDSITSVLNSPTESEVFSTVEYAEAHQVGSGRLPARPYFPVVGGRLTQYAEDRIYLIIDGWITRKLG